MARPLIILGVTAALGIGLICGVAAGQSSDYGVQQNEQSNTTLGDEVGTDTGFDKDLVPSSENEGSAMAEEPYRGGVDTNISIDSTSGTSKPSLGDKAYPGVNDTTAIWRGFRHAWSYNHRANRLGSWVQPENCDGSGCSYEVGHSGASGSGEDKAYVRDAYTEVSGNDVGFTSGEAKEIVLKGDEGRPDNGHPGTDEMITGTESVEVKLPSNMRNKDEYAVLLNGFDLKSVGISAKFIRFKIDVGTPKTMGNKLKFNIDYELLMDCDSLECKGTFKKDGTKRGGKVIQDVNYRLDVNYVAVAGDKDKLNIVEGNEFSNKEKWRKCENEVQSPTKKNQEDKWDEGFGNFQDGDSIPNDHMYCEGTKGELDYRDAVKRQTIKGEDDYSVGVLGMTDLSLKTHQEEAHLVQFDNVMGGNYHKRNGNYEAWAVPFFKEWSTRPGLYPAAATSYGHKGEATVETSPVLVQIKDGCKRSFVQGGGIHWPGGDRNSLSKKAVVNETETFGYGELWKGYGGLGTLCDSEAEGNIPEQLKNASHKDEAIWIEGFEKDKHKLTGLLKEEKTSQDPTQLRRRFSDRYYRNAGSNSAPPTNLDKIYMEFQGKLAKDSLTPPSGTDFYFEDLGRLMKEVEITQDINPPPGKVARKDLTREVYLNHFFTGQTKILSPTVPTDHSPVSSNISNIGFYGVEAVLDRDSSVKGTGLNPHKPSAAVSNLTVTKKEFVKNRGNYTFNGTAVGGGYKNVTYTRRAGKYRIYINDDGDVKEFVAKKPNETLVYKDNVTPYVKPDDVVTDARFEINGDWITNGETLTVVGCKISPCIPGNVLHPDPTNVRENQTYDLGIHVCIREKCGINEYIHVGNQTVGFGDVQSPEKVKIDKVNATKNGDFYDVSSDKVGVEWMKPKDEPVPGGSGVEKYKYGIGSMDKNLTDSQASKNAGTKQKMTKNYSGSAFGSGDKKPPKLQVTGIGDRKVTVDVSNLDRGSHIFKIQPVDSVGNEGLVTRVRLCVYDTDCKTVREKQKAAEDAQDAMEKQQAMKNKPGMVDPNCKMCGLQKKLESLGPGDGVCKVCDTGAPGWIAGNEKVDIIIKGEGGTRLNYMAKVKNGEITKLSKSNKGKPTMTAELDKATMKKIVESKDPRAEINKQYDKGNIKLSGNTFSDKFKLGTARAAKGVYDAAKGVADTVTGLIP
ncbi:MAG: hypothetical protein ABEK59_02205 [Halobacteria archaeon]